MAASPLPHRTVDADLRRLTLPIAHNAMALAVAFHRRLSPPPACDRRTCARHHVGNDLVMRLCCAWVAGGHGAPRKSGLLLLIRRGAIVSSCGWATLLLLRAKPRPCFDRPDLFSAVAQFAPAIIGGFSVRAHGAGAVSGWARGLVWIYKRLLPSSPSAAGSHHFLSPESRIRPSQRSSCSGFVFDVFPLPFWIMLATRVLLGSSVTGTERAGTAGDFRVRAQHPQPPRLPFWRGRALSTTS